MTDIPYTVYTIMYYTCHILQRTIINPSDVTYSNLQLQLNASLVDPINHLLTEELCDYVSYDQL